MYLGYYAEFLRRENARLVGRKARICPLCRKEFFTTTSAWVYKLNHDYYCSYKCFRKAQKEDSK